MKNFSLFLLIILTLCSLNSCLKNKAYDVVIYGATSAGIIAAVETARSGKTVIIINPNDHIGGLTTGGLGSTDIGNKKVIGGISREFYQRIKKYYENPDNWKWQKPSEYLVHGEPLDLTKEDAFWYFEPSAAMSVYQDFISEYQIPLLTDERLDLEKGVTMVDGKIIEITMESGKSFKGKMFIDATYEGDLMAVAGVSYTYGRESNSQYNETLNGVQTQRGKYHQFPDGIDPYMEPGNPESGLLPNINKDVGVEGTGDKKIQAYNFRLCLTDIPENRVDVEKPENYNELEYELLFRYFENGDPYRALYARGMMPNRKTDVNNGGPFSTDFIGRNYDYPEGDYAKREEIIAEHKEYHLGLLWTLANHPRVPEKYRNEYKKWGLAKDEYVSYGNFTPQIYVREARRMVSDYVMTELHCRQAGVSAEQSIGMGAYTMDSHHVQRYVNEDGWVKNEGDVQVGGFKPYPIDYRSIVPKKNECRNLLVPVCLSATHIAFGSIRMEPVFMILGQSAALAACLAIDEKIPVQDIDYEVLKTILLEKDVILKYPD
jgi:hypothetical protein